MLAVRNTGAVATLHRRRASNSEVVGPSGNNLAVVDRFNLSEPAKTLSFPAKSASALTCSDQRKATVLSNA